MDTKNGFIMTNRDKVLRAWQNSMELVRDFQTYANELDDDRSLSELFNEYAKDEARHAAAFLKLLQAFDKM